MQQKPPRIVSPLVLIHAIALPLIVAVWLFIIYQLRMPNLNLSATRGLITALADETPLNLGAGELLILIYISAALASLYSYSLRALKALRRDGISLFIFLQLLVLLAALPESGLTRAALALFGAASLISGISCYTAGRSRRELDGLSKARASRTSRIKTEIDDMLGK